VSTNDEELANKYSECIINIPFLESRKTTLNFTNNPNEFSTSSHTGLSIKEILNKS
jgi:hypothetical protein